MVVHDLLWLVLNLVSVTMLSSDTFSDAPLLPLSSVFDYTYLIFWNSFWTLCPVIAIGLFDRIVGSYTAFSASGVVTHELCRRSCIDCTPRVVSLWTGRKMVWSKVVHRLHARGCRTSKSMVIVLVEVNNDVRFYSQPSYSSSFSTGISLLPPGMMALMSLSMNSLRRWPSLQPPLPIYSTESILKFGLVGCSSLSSLGLSSSGHTRFVQAPFLITPSIINLTDIQQAVYSIISPGWFVTDVYGNDHFLFLSPNFYFSIFITVILALLPRCLYIAWSFGFHPNDLDILNWNYKMKPNMDLIHEAYLRQGEKEDARPPITPVTPNSATAGSLGRPSMHASQIDMSTGLRSQSRGYDFAQEENGVAIRRMQSNLSGVSPVKGRGGTLLRTLRNPLRRKHPQGEQ